MSELRNGEAQVYDLADSDLSKLVTDRDRMISEAIYKTKRHLGPRGMIEDALVIAREIESRQPFDTMQPRSNAAHYLNAIRIRLETLYGAASDNPRLREQLSDEVDWLDSQIKAQQS
jgi:hypothetical protein